MFSVQKPTQSHHVQVTSARTHCSFSVVVFSYIHSDLDQLVQRQTSVCFLGRDGARFFLLERST